MNKPALYIMCGLPFSGKSVLAKKLSEKKGFDLVEIDAIKSGYGLRDVWEHMKAEDWDKIFNDSFSQAANSMRAGRSIIYDSTNHTRKSRDELRALAERNDANSSVIFVDVSVDAAKERWHQNKETDKRMDLPEWAFNAALNSWEPPTEDENVLHYDPSEPIDNWIEDTFK